MIFPTQTLIEHVNNDFKTPEQIRFEKQLIDAQTKHDDAMGKAKTQIRIAWGAFITSLVAVIAAIAIPYIAKTRLAEINDITRAIEAVKTELPAVIETKVTNDTLKVNVVNSPITKN